MRATRSWALAGQAVVLGVVYFAVARASLLLAISPGYASAVWPASGIAAAALILRGSALWPGIWAGAAAAQFGVAHSALVAVVFATGATLEALAAALLFRRLVGVRGLFENAEQVVRFIAVAALVATIAPTLGLVPLSVDYRLPVEALFRNWWTSWQGIASGIVLVVPLALSWSVPGTVRWEGRKIGEAILLAALLLIAAWLAFSGGYDRGTPYSPTFVTVPFVVWVAFRFGQREVTTAIAAVCGIALWYTFGYQAGPLSAESANETLLMVLSYVTTMVFTGLVISAVLGQLGGAAAELRRRHDELESRVRNRTAELEEANRRLKEDVAARVRTEQALVEAEQRFRLMMASVVDYAILMLDPQGRVASWSPGAQRIHGYEAHEILGRHFSAFYPPEEVEEGRAQRHLETAAREGRVEDEGWRVRRDGSRFWANAVLTAVRDHDGSLLGFAEVTRDLTERKLNEAELVRAKAAAEKANAAKSQFLANMSHELRTPLNSLLILARLLADNAGGNLSEKQVRYASTIYAAGIDLLSLINDILDLAKIESGATSMLNIAPARLAKLEEDLERTFRQVAQEKGLEFEIALDAALPDTIRTDMARVEQVLKNLLSNAFKFTRRGSVRLKAAPARSGWTPGRGALDGARMVIAFSVTDTGIGIPEDRQAAIFEAFQQADSSTSRQYGGTGLGLSIAREFSRLLGGEVRVRSRPGAGSTFTLYLPVEPEES